MSLSLRNSTRRCTITGSSALNLARARSRRYNSHRKKHWNGCCEESKLADNRFDTEEVDDDRRDSEDRTRDKMGSAADNFHTLESESETDLDGTRPMRKLKTIELHEATLKLQHVTNRKVLQ